MARNGTVSSADSWPALQRDNSDDDFLDDQEQHHVSSTTLKRRRVQPERPNANNIFIWNALEHQCVVAKSPCKCTDSGVSTDVRPSDPETATAAKKLKNMHAHGHAHAHTCTHVCIHLGI